MIETKIKDFEEFRKIGESFNYLSIEMLVTKIEDDSIQVDYVDNNGVLRTIHFMHDELPILKQQNESNFDEFDNAAPNATHEGELIINKGEKQ